MLEMDWEGVWVISRHATGFNPRAAKIADCKIYASDNNFNKKNYYLLYIFIKLLTSRKAQKCGN